MAGSVKRTVNVTDADCYVKHEVPGMSQNVHYANKTTFGTNNIKIIIKKTLTNLLAPIIYI